MRSLVILLVLCAVASAETPQELYKQGRYPEAAEQFKAEYTRDPRPELLYNIAQSYRLAKDCANAASYYKKFLDAAPKDTPNLDRVRGYVSEMNACAKPAPEPTHAEPPAPTPPTIEPVEPSPSPSASANHPGTGRRHAGIAVGIAGVALAGAGLYFQHEVGVAENDRAACTPAHPCTVQQRADIDDRGNRNETLAITSYAVGAAAIAAGVTLYVLGTHASDEHVAVVPLPGGALASVGYAF